MIIVLVLALIIAVLQEPHPVRYALAGLLVLIARVGIFLKVKDRPTGTDQDQDQDQPDNDSAGGPSEFAPLPSPRTDRFSHVGIVPGKGPSCGTAGGRAGTAAARCRHRPDARSASAALRTEAFRRSLVAVMISCTRFGSAFPGDPWSKGGSGSYSIASWILRAISSP